MISYFKLKKISSSPSSKYSLTLDTSNLPFTGMKSSYTVLAARVMNMSFPMFLRMCRDVCKATLRGKNSVYVIPDFVRNNETITLVKVLNKRLELLMKGPVSAEMIETIEIHKQQKEIMRGLVKELEASRQQ